jgi:DNA invertase Pin-like site-specific DNA recombinase
MPKAFSYVRFSTPEQREGQSQRRQIALAEKYATQHGLELDRKTRYQDLGVSAFRGRNAEHGALADFRQAVQEGRIEK